MIIKLSKQKFWADSAYVERWPEMLKKLPQTLPETSQNQVAEIYFNQRKSPKGRIHFPEFPGLFGGEIEGNTIRILGCNYIRKTAVGYELTEHARRLVEAYKADENWPVLLMEQLLRYSLRIRAIFHALLSGGKLRFKSHFLKDMSGAYLEYEKENYFIFSYKKRVKNINGLMMLYPAISFGPFWLKELSLVLPDSYEISGGSGELPSIDNIATWLKIPFVLVDYLRWLKETGPGTFTIDKQKMKTEIRNDVWQSLVVQDSKNELDILKELVDKYSDSKGFFPVSVVGSLLKKEIEPVSELSDARWIDRFFMSGFSGKKFELVSYEKGQPIDGRGLLGRNDHQLIKIAFI